MRFIDGGPLRNSPARLGVVMIAALLAAAGLARAVRSSVSAGAGDAEVAASANAGLARGAADGEDAASRAGGGAAAGARPAAPASRADEARNSWVSSRVTSNPNRPAEAPGARISPGDTDGGSGSGARGGDQASQPDAGARAAGEAVIAEARRQAAGTLIGQVVSRATRAPVEGALVHAGAASPASVKTDEAGRFELRLAQGSQQLLIHSDAAGTEVALLTTRVTAGETTDAGVIEVAPPGRIAGIVRGIDGAPRAGVDVDVRIAGDPWDVKTDTEGRFAIEAVPEGVYFLSAQTTPEMVAGAHVVSGATAEVNLGGVAQITGTLRGPLGRPAGRDRSVAVVALEAISRASGADLIRAFGGAGGRTTEADDQGRFAIGGLAPGRYLVGKVWALAEVDVAADATGPVEVALEPCLIRARFTAAPGAPPPDGALGLAALAEEDFQRAATPLELVLATLSQESRDLAPEGGAALLVPRPGRYRIGCRGLGFATEPIYADASRAGPAEVMLTIAAAPGTLALRGFPPGEAGFVMVATERGGPSGQLAFTAFTETASLSLPDGKYFAVILHGERRQRRIFEVTPTQREVTLGPADAGE